MGTLVALDPRRHRTPATVDLYGLYLAGLAPGSRAAARSGLERLARAMSDGRLGAEHFDWAGLEPAELLGARAQLAGELAPATVNRILAHGRAVARLGWVAGVIDAERWLRIQAVGAVRGQSPRKGRALVPDEAAALLDACRADDNLVRGARDAALVAALLGGGLRRVEATRAQIGDWDPAGAALVVRGKGAKTRTVWLAPWAAGAVDRWMAIPGTEPGSLFVALRAGGRLTAKGLSGEAIRRVIARRAQEAGLEAVTPHDLRRSLITGLLDADVDLATVQRIAGHANLSTTVRYDRRGEDTARRACTDIGSHLVRPVQAQ